MDHDVENLEELGESSVRPVDGIANETVIVVNSSEGVSVNGEDEANSNRGVDLLEESKVCIDKVRTNVSQAEKHECVIDVKCNCGAWSQENWDGGEKICRICYLSADRPSEGSELIQLGCSCKDELGVAHRHCGEAWFKLKGNRCCEICGEAAKNITGVGDNGFMEEWNESGGDNSANSSDRRRFWQGQPFCNFLMACLIIAFILPWFFRVNLF